MPFPDPLVTVAVRRAEELMAHYAEAGAWTHDRWGRVLDGLRRDARGVIPRTLPKAPDTPVITFRADAEPFGPLLDAAACLVHDGDREAAHRTAEAARTLKVLSTVPHMRYRQHPAPDAGATPGSRFWHRVETEGEGFLPITVVELESALDGLLPDRGLLPRPAPDDPEAWVVVWRSLTAPAVVLGGVGMLATMPDRAGVDWLMQNLGTAARALEPGPPEREWKQ
jgi:hypothetical protein